MILAPILAIYSGVRKLVSYRKRSPLDYNHIKTGGSDIQIHDWESLTQGKWYFSPYLDTTCECGKQLRPNG